MSENNLLGIIGSYRKVGNSEIVAKAVAENMKGWDLSLIRLPSLKLHACKGCYACLLPDVSCNLDDDMQWLLDRMVEADAIIFTAPNYVLGPAGIVKMIADRALQAADLFHKFQEIPTAVALTLGREEYRGYSDSALLAQVGSLGLNITALEIFYGTHPGEITLLDGYQERIDRLTASLSGGNPFPAEITSPNRCPRCHSDLFRIVSGNIECALCKSQATIDNNKLQFYHYHPEFGPGRHDEHMKWLVGKKEEYQKIKEKLSEIRNRYRDGQWITPSNKDK